MNNRSTPNSALGRRGFITGLAVAGLTAWTAGAPAPLAVAKPVARRWSRDVSANGWPIVSPEATNLHALEGSQARVALLPGTVAAVLIHVLRRFHYEVLPLGASDVLGHSTDRAVRTPAESNYMSGTAIAIRPDRYPLGVSDGFTAAETAIIRDIVADCEGTVRWGADDLHHPKDGHFQIDVPPGSPLLKQVADSYRGQAAATMPDPFTATRKQRSDTLARRQRQPN